jgi:radical SAM superfamily enzyme YgiQ (UPF0313 family)
MKVKMILPALTEATSPLFRPIKYLLFPPLGLATLAAYLDPDDEVTITDEHVEKLKLDDRPELVVIQVYITSAYRSYQIADHYRRQGAYVVLGGLHVTSLPDEAAAHADSIFLGPVVYWTTEGSPDFTEANSASMPIQKTDKWVTGRINLGEIKTWDKTKSVVRLKIEIVTPDNVKVATIDPATKTSDSPQFVLNLMVFDRDSFSNTFER